ncbi:MAG: hypothetical protein HYW49_06855 [Deltaproteobacteria bacterium]|nr:hypothetical protein [Deltaproteobacteria bacterium]
MIDKPKVVNVEIVNWDRAELLLKGWYKGHWVRIKKGLLRVPTAGAEGFEISTGFPLGQINDYRRSNKDGTSMHIHEYENYYEAHIDAVDPKKDPIDHLRVDAPNVYALGIPLGFAALAALVGAKRPDIIFAGAVGLALVLLTLPRGQAVTE